MTEELSNAQAFIQAVENITEKGLAPSTATTPEDQAQAIENTVASLGAAQADVFAQLSDYFGNLAPGILATLQGTPTVSATGTEQDNAITGGGSSQTLPTFTACVDGQETTVQLPPPVGVDLPPIGKPDLEELFGAKATDPVDRFFINIAATVASIFVTFFGLGTVQAREVLQQYQATKPNAVLPPDLLADGVERNVVDMANATAQAAASGIGPEAFQDMVDLAGEPPGPIQAIELFRRELINDERFAQMIAYSRVKTEYIPDLLQLAYQTMSAADAVNGYVKGVPVVPEDFTKAGLLPPALTLPVAPTNPTTAEEDTYQQALRDYDLAMTDAYFAAMFKRGGALPSQWGILKEAAGDSVGTVHATQLLSHGDITLDQWYQIVGRSRINPIFYYAAKMSNKRWLGTYQYGQIVAADPGLADWAIAQMQKDGYSKEEATYYITVKAGGTPAKAKNDTEAQIIQQYEAGTIDQAGATQELATLGYKPAAISVILCAADSRLQLAINNSAIDRIRTAYLAGRIYPASAIETLSQPGTTVADINSYLLSQARAELIKLGITTERIAMYLQAWQVEKDTQFRSLTMAQVGALARKGRIKRDEAVARWIAMGYSADDADLLWQDYEPTTATLAHAVPAPGTPA